MQRKSVENLGVSGVQSDIFNFLTWTRRVINPPNRAMGPTAVDLVSISILP